ncbi:phosphonoacetaldehyde dehydrogenase, partial [Bosea sp. 2RAB26]
MNANVNPPVRRETMRIAGKLVSTDDMVEVRNPYDNSVVGLVPAARPEHVREAFAKARA